MHVIEDSNRIAHSHLCFNVGYIYETNEKVVDLILGVFWCGECEVPNMDCEAGERVDEILFPQNRSILMKSPIQTPMQRTIISRSYICGGVERSMIFFRWFLTTFIDQQDAVIKVDDDELAQAVLQGLPCLPDTLDFVMLGFGYTCIVQYGDA